MVRSWDLEQVRMGDRILHSRIGPKEFGEPLYSDGIVYSGVACMLFLNRRQHRYDGVIAVSLWQLGQFTTA